MMETNTQPTTSAAGDAVRTELSRIMSDPSHAMYDGYKRNDAQVNAYIDGLYKKAYGSAPVTFTQGITITGSPLPPQPANTDPDSVALSREASVAQTEIETMLRRTFGEEYDSEMRDMRVGVTHLFSQPDSVKVLDEVFAPVITRLGPHAEVAAIRFLAQLGRLSHTHTGGAQ